MKQSDLIVGNEVGVKTYLVVQHAKVLELAVQRTSARGRADGVRIEYLDPCDPHIPGEVKVVQSRHIVGLWADLLPGIEARAEEKRIVREMADEGAKRAKDLAEKIESIVGINPNVEVIRGRELGRTPSNKTILQDPGERIAIDTAALEDLLEQEVA